MVGADVVFILLTGLTAPPAPAFFPSKHPEAAAVLIHVLYAGQWTRPLQVVV